MFRETRKVIAVFTNLLHVVKTNSRLADRARLSEEEKRELSAAAARGSSGRR